MSDESLPRGKRGSEWQAIRRCLVLLRRLLRGPAQMEALFAAVQETDWGDELAYPTGQAARRAALKRDLAHLRTRLGARVVYDSRQHAYVLEDPGPFAYLELSPGELGALRLLWQIFDGDLGQQVEVRTLLDALLKRLPPQDRRDLNVSPHVLALDGLRGRDARPLSARVWSLVRRAVREHRKLAFQYLSPQHADRLPRYHELTPCRIAFRRGHWYLYAFDLLRREWQGETSVENGFKIFRLSYIQDDEHLVVLPTRVEASLARWPRYAVHYILLPPLGRSDISPHFEEMQVTHLSGDRAEVQGYTDDAWEAVRILLGYGDSCLVLGGEEIRQRIERTVRGMGRLYLDENID